MCFGVSMITLVEINAEGFLWKCLKKASVYGQNHRAVQVPINERYWTLFTKENFSGVM